MDDQIREAEELLRAWRLKNFKSVRDGVDLELAPLTVLAGANSSGKSTVIQSILAASQTLASVSAEDALVLNGPISRLGYLKDLRTQGTRHRSVTFGFTVDIPESPGTRTVKPATAPNTATIKVVVSPDPATDAPRLDSIALAFGGHAGSVLRANRGRTGKRLAVQVALTSVVRRRLPVWIMRVEMRLAPDVPTLLPPSRSTRAKFRLRPASRIAGVQLQGFVPVGLAVVEDEGVVAAEEFIATLRDPNRFGALFSRRLSDWFSAELLSFLQARGARRTRLPRTVSSGLAAAHRLDREARQELANAFESRLIDAPDRFTTGATRISIIPLPAELDAAAEAAIDVLSSKLRYLGPLREDPRATYDLPPSGQKADVGLKGEYTAAALHLYRDQYVAHRHPVSGRLVRQTLRRAVDDWLKHLGLLDAARPSAPSRFGHQLLLAPAGLSSPVDPTYVGVGVSQALPVLVQGLLTPPGGVLILEQPELHLHPDVQADLADFLLALTATNRQVIVETHSEHLVNRLRLRVAEAIVPTEEASIYFVTRSQDEGSRFEKLGLTQAGALTSWPEGFLDRASRDAQSLIQANLRRIEER